MKRDNINSNCSYISNDTNDHFEENGESQKQSDIYAHKMLANRIMLLPRSPGERGEGGKFPQGPGRIRYVGGPIFVIFFVIGALSNHNYAS